MEDNARNQIAEVIAARQTEAALREAMAEKRAAFEAENAELIASLEMAKAATAEAESTLRAIGKAEYEKTGNKKPLPGVGVRVSKKLIYDDAAALAWAEESAPALILRVLDKKAFEALVAAKPLPFVGAKDEVVITLASKLEDVA